MVNVSILTMGQARALGIEGRLLREFGLAALMHDIGKVRTPNEILNKPDKLTDDEFAIMRRHTVDGAEILRRTPDMPALAPVVAFEHHLRQRRHRLPGGRETRRRSTSARCSAASPTSTTRCARSARTSRRSRPIASSPCSSATTARSSIRTWSDASFSCSASTRRATWCRLKTGEVAVVTEVHAPDPHRPRVRVLYRHRWHTARPALRPQLVGGGSRRRRGALDRCAGRSRRVRHRPAQSHGDAVTPTPGAGARPADSNCGRACNTIRARSPSRTRLVGGAGRPASTSNSYTLRA